jgi:hypothetical protein
MYSTKSVYLLFWMGGSDMLILFAHALHWLSRLVSCLDGFCGANGVCAGPNTCQCNAGWSGEQCRSRGSFNIIISHLVAICSPSCLNGGSCTAPSVCSCPARFGGPVCGTGTRCFVAHAYEPALCDPPCLNGGVCAVLTESSNTCSCPRASDTSGLILWVGNTCQIGVSP